MNTKTINSIEDVPGYASEARRVRRLSGTLEPAICGRAEVPQQGQRNPLNISEGIIVNTINSTGIAEIYEFIVANHKRGVDFSASMLRAWAEGAEFQLGNDAHIDTVLRSIVKPL